MAPSSVSSFLAICEGFLLLSFSIGWDKGAKFPFTLSLLCNRNQNPIPHTLEIVELSQSLNEKSRLR